MPGRVAIRRTTGRDPAFSTLTGRLDAELWFRYGEIQAAYAVHNQFVPETAVVAYVGELAVGCACWRPYDSTTAELKRMFVETAHRWAGIGKAIVNEIEAWAIELGYTMVVLETGIRQPEAVGLYESRGYTMIDNYGAYAGLANSVCMRKRLRRPTPP